VPLTGTDWGIFLWLAARRGRCIVDVLADCFDADNRDADAMLTMVEVHASRVVQSRRGYWHYFGHSSQSVFQNEILQ